MEWQATDQFGNLYVGESDAESVEELKPHLEMLLLALRERCGDSFSVTVDFGGRDICGPDPEQVAYVIRCPWLGSCDRAAVKAELESAFAELLITKELSNVRLLFS